MRRWRRPRAPMTRGQRARAACAVLALVLVVLTIVVLSHLQTLLGDLAVTRVSNSVNRLVVAAVSDAIESGEIQYDRLITLQKDNSGRITALQSNMAEFNRLQSAITEDVLHRLSQMSDTQLSIPIGTLTGSALLAGHGPRLTVKMQSTGSCSAHFENQFFDAGINQTTHSILLYVDVSVTILLPGLSTRTQVSSSFSVAETVIVGDVPDTYTQFDSGNAAEDDAYEYAINNG